MLTLKVNLENCENTNKLKSGHHNKFYDIELTEGENGHTTIQIFSGRFGKTRVQQKPKATKDGWPGWIYGFEWVVGQVEKKIGEGNYSLEMIETNDPHAKVTIESIANRYRRNNRYAKENFTYF